MLKPARIRKNAIPAKRAILVFSAVTLVVGTCFSRAETVQTVVPPDTRLSSGTSSIPAATAKQFMIATAHPIATRTGYEILDKGGTAIDAMVAVQAVLGLVEPQSSGIGGGAFLVYWDNDAKKLTTYDGRETAPLAAGPDLFLNDVGEPLQFFDAVIGGRSVGTPGTVALMEAAHKEFGKLGWEDLLAPAITLAEDGFEISQRLNESIKSEAESLFRLAATRNYFLSEEGVPLFPGTVVTNQPYADTLRTIATQGATGFYRGEIAADIVAAVETVPENPGLLSLEDLESYRVIEREPVCVSYRAYDVCGMGPPSSGALTVGQILKLVEPFDLAAKGADDPQSWRIIGDAMRLAFADRDLYMADSDFVKIPGGLLDKEYLAQRARLIEGTAALPDSAVEPGTPPQDHTLNFGADSSLEIPSTSHFCIVDASGNVVSMTTTIESAFGSRLMVRGFLLNNELTDFSFRPDVDGRSVANRVEPGKRPRSSMSPTIVLKDGEPVFVIGSPGGSRIIPFVAKTLIAHLDWGLDVQQAIDLPHMINRYGKFELETGTPAEHYQPALEALGYQISIRPLESGLQGITITPSGLMGGADQRREGLASGK